MAIVLGVFFALVLFLWMRRRAKWAHTDALRPQYVRDPNRARFSPPRRGRF